MAFMKLQTDYCAMFSVECGCMGSYLIPADLVGDNPEREDFRDYVDGEPLEYTRVEGWFCRYSAPGYMDCTDWIGPYETEEEAIEECEALYGLEEYDVF
jgi:hypothetical protein